MTRTVKRFLVPLACIAATLLAPGVLAQTDPTPDPVSPADTAWVLIASALVMLMTPGLALFYGGMVRNKNVVNTLMIVFTILGVITVQWALFGYSLAFGPTVGGVIGNLDWAFLNGVSASAPNPDYAGTIPSQAFMIFQMMFAVITPALIIGAVAERVRFSALIAFVVLWATLVYDPIAHWVWGVGGWLRGLGTLDFAGGLVVHISSGVAALAAAIYLGRRIDHHQAKPHNLVLVIFGAGLLWFGWFGFNAGSALGVGALATSAFVTTHLASAAGALGWSALDWRLKGKPTILGAASGAIAGLVAITPAAGFVTPMAALALGLIAGAACYWGVRIKDRAGFDDALDAFGVHGVGGIVGALLTGVFATVAVNAGGADGLLHGGGFTLLVAQITSILVVCAYTFTVTWGILWGIDKVMTLRIAPEHERAGLDVSVHGEIGYDLGRPTTVLAALSQMEDTPGK